MLGKKNPLSNFYSLFNSHIYSCVLCSRMKNRSIWGANRHARTHNTRKRNIYNIATCAMLCVYVFIYIRLSFILYNNYFHCTNLDVYFLLFLFLILLMPDFIQLFHVHSFCSFHPKIIWRTEWERASECVCERESN